MTNIFINDPLSMVFQAFKNLYPDKKIVCYFHPRLNACDGIDDTYGFTEFCSDGNTKVFIDVNISIKDAVDIFAHELAHVAVDNATEHDRKWKDAYGALYKEYMLIGDEMFGKDENEPVE